MHSLPVFLRLEGRPVILIGSGDTADAKRRLLERAGARIVDEAGNAALAIVALDEDAEAEAAVARLKARGILVNAVDRPALCDFTLPAIVDRDPVLVAIGTGGASAGLAKALRQRLEALLPSGLGALADALHGARGAIRAQFPDATTRRRAIDAALDPGGPLDPLGDVPATAVARWLAAPDAPRPAVTVRIALRSDDPDDLTLAEARWLGQADRVYHDVGVPPAILRRVRADAACIAGSPPEDLPAGVTILLTLD
ncbi:precorrin-2 dehydrogenase/sirohydrochlorin ferrochelatase family protein [Sphingomonas sp. PR090111-T3T-6A]|uniref:precorrin-2 dehydrogenase/sirohydrochlorin ferrochelatase family protein n=1 Tax=Sphingomonas sp. PR090111-T3T-6A TaxID=685778 RepID=UPI000364055A|nr:bifunctional precorrin-2 dehydrogenase/sirohydrochlorin ferrochelatase [Sphingomonas sp. PR090111-T3T-6A]